MNKAILLVEDDKNDVIFLKNAFKNVGIFNPMEVAPDGRAAIDYLSGNGKYADRNRYPMPCLVLLDLKLPLMMGLVVLKWIRGQTELRNLIVIILTSSHLAPDIEMAYQLGANAYLVKPSSPAELVKIAAGIKLFWLELNHGPVALDHAMGKHANSPSKSPPARPAADTPESNGVVHSHHLPKA